MPIILFFLLFTSVVSNLILVCHYLDLKEHLRFLQHTNSTVNDINHKLFQQKLYDRATSKCNHSFKDISDR